MKRIALVGMCLLLSIPFWAISLVAVESGDVADRYRRANQLEQDNNYSEAATLYREIIQDPEASGSVLVQSLQNLRRCQQQLRLEGTLDGDLAAAIAQHPDDYRVVDEAADQLLSAIHFGMVADQKFYRGFDNGYGGRGGFDGLRVNVSEQDRLQVLRWRVQAIEIARRPASDAGPAELARLHLALANTLLFKRTQMQGWGLQGLSDLESELDYLNSCEELPQRDAAVDTDGNPTLYRLPTSWEAADSDGARLRWALSQAEETDKYRWEAKILWADFLQTQFSVATLQRDPWLFRRANQYGADDTDTQEGIVALHTLKENETIAKLASGVQRFPLPDDFNPIRLYQEIASSQADEINARAAWNLVQIFLNRRQYATAAERIEAFLQRFGDDRRKSKQTLLDDIRQPRFDFETNPTQLAGRKATLSVLFRNATELSFTAHQVDVESILRDTKEYYRRFDPQNRPAFGGKRNESPPRLESPASLFDEQRIDRYLLDQVAQWKQAVEPRPNHWDRRVEIETPLTKPGLYLVEGAAGADGQKTRCLVWIQDTLLVRKPLDGKWLLHVADAESGLPVAGANLELFGYGYDRQTNRSRPPMLTENFAANTDADGLSEVTVRPDFQWMCVARTREGRLALLDFDHLWRSQRGDASFRALKAYGVSDRPAYRPGETVKAKFWLAYTVYGDVEPPRVANTKVSIALRDAEGQQIAEQTLVTDEYGGCDLEIALSEAAPLGRFYFQVSLPEDLPAGAAAEPAVGTGNRERLGVDPPSNNRSVITSLSIRVEEYRKPEFEVQVSAPDKPVALGETIKARIEAKYYFGAPVTDAQVSVKVERTTVREQFYPVAIFDWCYGPGYWWFATDYDWYPGWERWHGCTAPIRAWGMPWSNEPPELVLEQNVQLDATGQAVVEIDTALAKQLYGQTDHKYTISVEVRDASRRTIAAQGSVMAAREAFKIYTWTDRGYYNVGDRIVAHFQARMLDGAPVAGNGQVDLLRITYDTDLQPQEQVVVSFGVTTDEAGQCSQELQADRAGQYRVRLRLTDEQGHQVEGAYIFTVRGEGAAGEDFRYSGLELLPDKQHYAPGETVKLQLAANRADALVAVFLRPLNGVYSPPQWVRLTGKSAVLEIPVEEADQPNFFVEAYTCYDGKCHHQLREIFVPPAERVLDVKISTDKSEYLPGEEATVEVNVKNLEGKAVATSCVLAVYDRALDAIAGDVLPPDIREFFWKWQRHHHPQQRVNLDTQQYAIQVRGEPAMKPLGIFGSTLADDADAFADSRVMPKAFRASGGAVPTSGLMADSMSMDGTAMMAAAVPEAEFGVGMNNPQSQPVPVRQDFADSALWLADLRTDSRGKATAKFKMPDNLTSWSLRGWALGEQTRVGSARSEAVTRKPLLVRLQTPRFLVERDEVVISAIVHNDLAEKRTVQVSLEVDGQTQFELLPGTPPQQNVDIAAHQQARVDWRCRALAAGTITLRSIAITDDASDAMQLKLPIVVNGILRTESFAGTVRTGQESSVIQMVIPPQRRVEQSSLTVRLSPSLAASMIDALPYTAEYPYECTEQTLNRFLPSLITQRLLQGMEVDLVQLRKQRNNLNAQELGAPEQRNSPSQHFDRESVFDENLVAQMVDAGVRRLTEMQNADGGWGWFSGAMEYSTAHTTATVVRGLLVAEQNQVAIVPDVLQRGIAWLEQYQTRELMKLQNAAEKKKPFKQHPDNVDALVFHVLVAADRSNADMQRILYEQRGELSTYGKALLAWATHRLGDETQTSMLRRNLEQFLVEDPENETAFLRDGSAWWYWYGSEIEANAMYLKLLSAVEPQGRVAPRIVKFLLNNRKHATYWNSTRDTALVIEAFADYLRATEELHSDMTAEVWLAGKRLGKVEFTPRNLFSVDNSIVITGSAIPTGELSLEIKRSGGGNLYWNAYATNFTLEDEILPAGLEVKIDRAYYLLEPAKRDITLPGARANIVNAEQAVMERTLIEDLQDVPSGSLVEVELLVQSKNDYEYLLIEDSKPASLEAVDTQSGYYYNAGLSIYREFRDKHVGLCIRWLPKGNYSIRYQLRSEAPGRFTALPAVIQGMYAPELRGNSSDFDLSVVEE